MSQARPAETLQHRMLQIEGGLRAALEARGHEVHAGLAIVDGEQIKFWTYEASRQRRVPITPKDFGYLSSVEQWRHVLVPSGQPTLVAMPMPHGRERRWTDRPGKSLEAQLDQIVIRFEVMAKDMIEGRAKSEEYHRWLKVRQRKAARRWHKELEREAQPERLRTWVEEWHEAQRMRAFLDALEGRLADRPVPPSLTAWLVCARDYAAELDPLTEEGLEMLQDHADAVAPGPEDDEEPDPYEMDWRHLGMLDEFM
ncbi:MAG: hypothetical protein Q8L23_01125 [Caulobacter sp.]|nr:hypothetical protein [Caulobacter sp.]